MVGRFGCLCLDWQIYQWIIEIAKVSTAMEFVSRTVRKTVPGDAHVAHGWTYEICLVEITFPVNPWCCCCLQCWYSDWYCCSTILMCLNIVCSLYEVLFMYVKNVFLCISVFCLVTEGTIFGCWFYPAYDVSRFRTMGSICLTTTCVIPFPIIEDPTTNSTVG